MAHNSGLLNVQNLFTSKVGRDVDGVLRDLFSDVGEGEGGGAPVDATYIVQTPSDTLTAEQALSLLSTGYAKVETGSGIVSTVTTIPATDVSVTTTGLINTDANDLQEAVQDLDAAITGLGTLEGFIRADGTVDFTANQSMAGFILTGLSSPVNPTDAVNKAYVDALSVTGIDVHQSVRAATTANITLANEQTIDGVALVAGDRVLVKNQTAGEENGFYNVVNAGAWTRTTDADTDAEVNPGIFAFVEEGTANGDTGWLLITDDPITLGTTPLVFTQFSAAGAIVAGDGLQATGNTWSVGVDGITIEINADALRVKALGITDAHVATANKDGAALTPSMRTLGTAATQAAAGNDPRFTDSRTPTGPAGGVLSGTYPNPGFAVDMATQAELDAHLNDAADAHDASAVSYSNVTSGLTATEVQAAIDEVAAAIDVLPGQIVAGDGLTLTGDTLSVNVDGTTLEIVTDIVRVKDLGISTAKLANNAVTYAKMQAISQNVLLGNDAAGATVEEIPCTAFARTILDDTTAKISRGTLLFSKGANVASANNLAPGADGLVFHITGTNQINLIADTNFNAGDTIVLIFDGACLVKHNQTVSGANKPILLAGDVDWTTAVNDVLALTYDGTSWYDTRRGLLSQLGILPINNQSGTTYAPVLSDRGKLINCTNASAITVTIPANASVPFPIGTVFQVRQGGLGQVTMAITTDTLNIPNGAKTAKQFSYLSLTKVAATEWDVSGDSAV